MGWGGGGAGGDGDMLAYREYSIGVNAVVFLADAAKIPPLPVSYSLFSLCFASKYSPSLVKKQVGATKSYDSKMRRNSRIEGVTGEQSSFFFKNRRWKRDFASLLRKKGDKIKEENLLLLLIWALVYVELYYAS